MNRLMREEARLKGGSSDDSAFQASKKSLPVRRNKTQAKQGKGAFKYNCWSCGQNGHRQADCPNKNQQRMQAAGTSRGSNNSNKAGNSSKSGSSAFTFDLERNMKHVWIMDSGASTHLCPNRDWFAEFNDKRSVIVLADGRKTAIEGYGTVNVVSQTSDGEKVIPITNVKYVPEGRCCLFSLTAVEDKGYNVTFEDGKCFVMKGDDHEAVGHRVGNLYEMDFRVAHVGHDVADTIADSDNNIMQWHRRLAHVNIKKVVKTMRMSEVPGKEPSHPCKGCIMGKQHRCSLPVAKKVREDKPGIVVHADLAGPMRNASVGGSKYFLLVKDDCSGHSFTS